MNEGLARGLGGANVAHVSIVPREAVGGAEARGAADTSLLIRLSPDVLMAAVFSGHGAHADPSPSPTPKPKPKPKHKPKHKLDPERNPSPNPNPSPNAGAHGAAAAHAAATAIRKFMTEHLTPT